MSKAKRVRKLAPKLTARYYLAKIRKTLKSPPKNESKTISLLDVYSLSDTNRPKQQKFTSQTKPIGHNVTTQYKQDQPRLKTQTTNNTNFSSEAS